MLAALGLLVLGGCGQQESLQGCGAGVTVCSGSVSLAMQAFTAGDAVMRCRLNCSGAYGFHRLGLKQDYASQDWNALAQEVLVIGNDNDQAWFYLGRAAEGLGDYDAAQIYYMRSLIAFYHCNGLLNVCDGLDLPRLTESRLDAVDAQLLSLPEYAPLAAPLAPPGTAAQVPLGSDSHGFVVTALVGGRIPVRLLVRADGYPRTVHLPVVVVALMSRRGMLGPTEVMGVTKITLPDGRTAKTLIFKIKTLRVGTVQMNDVVATFSFLPGEGILGQTFLHRLKSWSVDDAQQSLVMQQ
jgi:hypothetical protein